MCGLPGSGKTTRAKLLQIRIDAIRLCPDEWMEALSLDIYDEERRGKIEALQWQFGRQLLARDLTVIIEWGTWARSERDTLRLGARELGATVELHCLTAPIDVLFERLRRRGVENPPIEFADLSRSAEIFQTPTPEEKCLSSTRPRIRATLHKNLCEFQAGKIDVFLLHNSVA